MFSAIAVTIIVPMGVRVVIVSRRFQANYAARLLSWSQMRIYAYEGTNLNPVVNRSDAHICNFSASMMWTVPAAVCPDLLNV